MFILLWLAFLFPSSRIVGDFTIDVSTDAVFKRDEDMMWRCYANITIQNIHSENITLIWVSINLINITFADETSQQLMKLAGYNFTYDPPLVLEPEGMFTLGMVATEFGFYEEPKLIWIRLSSSFFEAKSPLVIALPIVPEFQSTLILVMFIITTLVAIMLKKLYVDESQPREQVIFRV